MIPNITSMISSNQESRNHPLFQITKSIYKEKIHKTPKIHISIKKTTKKTKNETKLRP